MNISISTHRRRHESGSAVLVVIAIIAILLIYAGGNVRTLHLLKRDLQNVEQKQIQRVSRIAIQTNAPPPASKPIEQTNAPRVPGP